MSHCHHQVQLEYHEISHDPELGLLLFSNCKYLFSLSFEFSMHDIMHKWSVGDKKMDPDLCITEDNILDIYEQTTPKTATG